jgi:hypothetical protein
MGFVRLAPMLMARATSRFATRRLGVVRGVVALSAMRRVTAMGMFIVMVHRGLLIFSRSNLSSVLRAGVARWPYCSIRPVAFDRQDSLLRAESVLLAEAAPV